jgi:hypothetical protein
VKIRSSSYDCARKCEQLFYYKYVLGLVPNKYKNVDLYFGSCLHEAIKAFHSGDDPMQVWHNYDNSISCQDKNPHIGRVLTKMYMKNPLDMVDTEKPFSILIGKHNWVGRYDGIANKHNSLYVAEHKTSRWGTSSKFTLQTKPNNQFISYVLGGRIYYKDIDSMIVNLFNVRELKIEPLLVTFRDHEIDRWINSTKLFLAHLVRCIHTGFFPRSNDCLMYGHECAYKKICLASSPQNIIDRCFHVDEEAKNMSW